MSSWGRISGGLGALLALGCGRVSTDAAVADGSAAGSAGTSLGVPDAAIDVADAATATPPCPADPPANESPCTLPDAPYQAVQCSWGTDPRPMCRTTAFCARGQWIVQPPRTTRPYSAYSAGYGGFSDCTAPPLDALCPIDPPMEGSACGPADFPCSCPAGCGHEPDVASCWYADFRLCVCTKRGLEGGGSCSDQPYWQCFAPTGPGCPTALPQAGSPCDLPAGSACNARPCSAIPNLDCEEVGGTRVWQWTTEECPACASPETPIATPSGERPIASLRVGDVVFSVDHDAIVTVPILDVRRTPVRAHHVVQVRLDDGVVLEISAGHPTAQGRTFGELKAGNMLDEQHRVTSVRVVPYAHDATYDILPGSSTGTYFAGGALIGSTLVSSQKRLRQSPMSPHTG